MDSSLLFWVYLINAVILINHEIDSAYWQEWKLINPKDQSDAKGFLIVHFPMLFLILYGLVLVDRGLLAGMIISLLLAASGIFAFFFHFYHLRKGRQEFNNWVSKLILILTLPISIFQVVITITSLSK